jgi:membrane protein YdbS with pleckstrin-like domain
VDEQEPGFTLPSEPPTYSPLVLRIVLAVFGFVACVVLAAVNVGVDGPAWLTWALGVLAVLAVIDSIVIGGRLRRRRPR